MPARRSAAAAHVPGLTPREAILLAAAARLRGRESAVTVKTLAAITGWTFLEVSAVRADLVARGLWPEDATPPAMPAGRPKVRNPSLGQIAERAAAIRADWDELRWSRQPGAVRLVTFRLPVLPRSWWRDDERT